MLPIEDTGYEGKYDFPLRSAPPALVYMLATVPRTGSSYFSHLLWKSGCLGAPLEYLNYQGPYGFAAHSPDLQHMLWRSALHRRTSPNGVFGFKTFPVQLQDLEESNQALLAQVMGTVLGARPPRIVHLARRDRVAHMVSYARAALSGRWRSEQEGADTEVPYSDAMLETAGRLIDSQSEAWEMMFRELSITPLRLWYEDIAARPAEAVAQVAEFLGVTLTPDAQVNIPEVRKQAGGDAQAWAERYAAERGGTTP